MLDYHSTAGLPQYNAGLPQYCLEHQQFGTEPSSTCSKYELKIEMCSYTPAGVYWHDPYTRKTAERQEKFKPKENYGLRKTIWKG